MSAAAASLDLDLAPASPKPAAGASLEFTTPSKRAVPEGGASDAGPAVAAKRRRAATAPAAPPPEPPRDVTCGVCLGPVAAACKPEGCSHIMCHTCAYGLWCCPQCRVEVPRPCPTCRRETYFDELEGDRDADKVASAAAKSELDSAELAQWRQRKKDGQALSARTKKDSVQAMQLALQEEKDFVHAVVASRSPTSRATCACCSQTISAGSLRVHRSDGRFSHVRCHDMDAELQEICAGERKGLGEVHVSVDTNIVDPKLMRVSTCELRHVEAEELRTLRQKLTNAAGMSEWFCESLHACCCRCAPLPPPLRRHIVVYTDVRSS
jgi:hypothetical protein